jgi:signal transduction histidine kinase
MLYKFTAIGIFSFLFTLGAETIKHDQSFQKINTQTIYSGEIFSLEKGWRLFPSTTLISGKGNKNPQPHCQMSSSIKWKQTEFNQILCGNWNLNPNWEKEFSKESIEVDLPNTWSTTKDISGNFILPTGSHVYTKNFEWEGPRINLALKHGDSFYSSYRIWIKKGEAWEYVCGSGIPSQTKESAKDSLHKGICELESHFDVIAVEVGNWTYNTGYFWKPIAIGEKNQFYQNYILWQIMIGSFLGMFFLFGFYFGYLYLLQKEDKLYGIVSFGSFIYFFRILIKERVVQSLFPDWNIGDILMWIDYTYIPLACVCFFQYIKHSIRIFNKYKYINYYIYLSFFLIFFIVTIFPPLIYTNYLLYFQANVIVFMILFMYIFILEWYIGNIHIYNFILIYLIVNVFSIFDILYAWGFVSGLELSYFSQLLFIINQGFYSSQENIKNVKIIQEFKNDLELKVEERTKELEKANLDLLNQREFLIQAEEESKKKSLRIQRIQEISMIVQKSKNFDEMLEKVKERLYFHYGFQNYTIYLMNHEKNELEFLRLEYLDIVPKEVIDKVDKSNIPINDESSIHAAVIRNQKSLLLKRVLTDKINPSEIYNMKVYGINAIYFLPLFAEDRIFALFTIVDVNPEFQYKDSVKNLKREDKEEIEILFQSIGNSLFQSLQKKNLETAESQSRVLNQELNKQKTRLERIQKASLRIQNATSFDSMCDNLKEEFLNSFGIQTYMLYIANFNTKDLQFNRVESITKVPDEVSSVLSSNPLNWESKNSVHGIVMNYKRPLYIKNANRGEMSKEEMINKSLVNISSLFILPLIVEAEVFAILTFPDVDPKYGITHRVNTLSKNDRDDIEILSQSIASAFFQSLQKQKIESSEIELKNQKRRLEVIQEASVLIQDQRNFDSMLSRLKEVFKEKYNISTFFFYILNSSNKLLELYSLSCDYPVKRDLFEELLDMKIDLSDPKGVHHVSYKNKKPFFLKDLTRGGTETENRIRNRIQLTSMFVIPLVVEGEVYAFLTFGDVGPEYQKEIRIKSLKKSERDDLVLLSQSIANSFYQTIQKQKIQDSKEALSKAERDSQVNQLAAHIAHEVNNPLNFISTGESIIESTMKESSELILGAIPETEESKSFRSKIMQYFSDFQIGIDQIKKGLSRIKDTVSEIRAITRVDGIQINNFDLSSVYRESLDQILEKNQVSLKDFKIFTEDISWPNYPEISNPTLSQSHILGRAFRTLFNEVISRGKNSGKHPVQINTTIQLVSELPVKLYSAQISYNGLPLSQDEEKEIFNLKNQSSKGTELIGLGMVKELLKSVQCNMSLIDHGRESGWITYQILVKDFE